VRVIVQKPGMVVVNDIQQELALPKDSATAPLVLLLCTPEDRDEMARRFYRLKHVEAADRTYKEKLRALQEKNEATEAAIRRLNEERDQAVALAQARAEQIVRMKPEESSPLYREAMSFFVDGDDERAMATLDDETLRGAAASARVHQHQVVDAYLLKGRLLTGRFEFEQAAAAYRAAVAFAPDDFEANYELALFNGDLNERAEAEAGYRRALTIARRANEPADVAMTLNSLGILLKDQERWREARKVYDEAVQIYRTLGRSDSYFELFVGDTLNNLGNLLLDQNETRAAHDVFEEVIEIRRKLARRRSERHLARLGIALINAGRLRAAEHRPDAAEAAYNEALAIFDDLTDRHPSEYRYELASALTNLGNLLGDQRQWRNAREVHEEAVGIFRDLAKRNPALHRPDLAAALTNLAKSARALHRFSEARKLCDESLNIFRQLALRYPNAYSRDMAWTLDQSGILARQENRTEDARKAFEEALVIQRRLTAENRGAHLPDLAATLRDLADLLYDQDQLKESETFTRESLEAYRALAPLDPVEFLPDLALILANLSYLRKMQGGLTEAEERSEESLRVFRRLATGNPAFGSWDVAIALNDLGDVYLVAEQYECAGAAFTEAIEIYRTLVKQDRGYARGLALSLTGAAAVLGKQQKVVPARASLREALELYAESDAMDPDEQDQDVARAQTLLKELSP
jgi:tetratricopeptide (TPR) repeat protein